jgi:hypothetical protein
MPVDSNVEYDPPLPQLFLLTISHPRSHKMLSIVPLDDPPRDLPERTLAIPINPNKPYAPFRTYADYRMASKCIRNAWSDRVIQNKLDEEHEGIYNGTAGECQLMIRTVKHMADGLAAARTLTVEVFDLAHFLLILAYLPCSSNAPPFPLISLPTPKPIDFVKRSKLKLIFATLETSSRTGAATLRLRPAVPGSQFASISAAAGP